MPRRFPDGRPSVIPATVAQIERRLPAAGELMVRVGSRVEPDDLIGQCSVQHTPVVLDVAGALGVEPRNLRRRLRRRVGERVGFRDLLARRRGRSVLAPFTGTITDIDEVTGCLTVTPDPVPASTPAAIRGYVVDVEPERAATIKTAAAIVQGAAGFGGEQWGLLRRLVDDPATIITADMIDASSAWTILVGGAGITAEALRKAQHEQVKGIVVGSVDSDELREFWGERFSGNWSYILRSGAPVPEHDDAPTLIMTEGFGIHPMSRPLFDLLARLDGHEAHMDGTLRLAPPQRRPRLVVPLPRLPGGATSTPVEQPRGDLPNVGAIVRLLDEAHLGSIGRVERLQPHGRLASGVRTLTATVQIGEIERVTLPVLVLEVIG